MTYEEIANKLKTEVESIAQTTVEIKQELYKTGPLDSLNVINLLTFIETDFNVRIGPFDVTLENFNTIDKMALYILSKLNL